MKLCMTRSASRLTMSLALCLCAASGSYLANAVEAQSQESEQEEQEEDLDDKVEGENAPSQVKTIPIADKKQGAASKPVATDSSDLANMSPDAAVAWVQNKVVLLKQQVNASAKLYYEKGMGAQNTMAEYSYNEAIRNYAQAEYQSAIHNLNNFLNWSQMPEIGSYLQANYILTKSYIQTQDYRLATRAAARYLSTLATNPEHASQKGIEMMADLLMLVEKHRRGRDIQLNPLMAALTSLDMSKQQKAWTYFYAGKSARITGNDNVGIGWFEKVIQMSTNRYLVARARYNRSLIYIRNRQYHKAVLDLKAALEEKGEGAYDYREFAKLALARVHVHVRKPKTALKYYNDVDEKSEAYQEALFEKVYIYLDQNRFADAILAAEEYLLRFPRANDVYQIRSIKAYMDLRNNDIQSATQYIKVNNQRLAGIAQWLRDNYGQRDTLTPLDISGIIKITNSEVAQPPIILHGRRLFDRLEANLIRLGDIRNDLRNAVYTMGRANANLIKPAWQQRLSQLQRLMHDTLQTGDMLVQAEAKMYQSSLSERDAYLLTASHKRRMRNFSKVAAFSRKRGPWQFWANLGFGLTRLSNRYAQVKSQQAELANLKLLAKTTKVARPQARLAEIDELVAKSNLLENEIMRGVEVVRSRQTMLAIGMSDLYPLKNVTKSYTADLLTEMATLTPYRQNYRTPQQQHLSDDLTEIWQHWEYVLKEAYTQIIRLEQDMEQGIRERLTDFDDMIGEHDRLMAAVNGTSANLEQNLGKYLGLILEHYHSRIAARLAKHQKWQADLHWLAYDQTKLEERHALSKYDLEQQILTENLKDLEQGVLSRWP